MKNIEIVQMYDILQPVKNKKLPISLSFILSKNLKLLDECNREFEEARNSILQNYGEKDESGNLVLQKDNRIIIPKENESKFLSEIKTLEDIDIELNLQKIPESSILALDQLSDVDRLTVDEVGELYKMVEEIN